MKSRLAVRALVLCLVFAALIVTLNNCRNAPPTAAPPATTGGGNAPTAASGGFPRTITDGRGKTLTLNAPPQRIISLAPSNTEILFALGLGDRIAGDTTACDYPPEAQSKPHIGGFQTDIESVETKNPDLIVAVAGVNDKAIEALETAHLPVLAINAKTVQDTYGSIALIGKATGQDTQAEQVVHDMQARMTKITQAVQGAKSKPKVLIVYGVKPTIYTTGPGSYIDDLITIAGGQNIVTTPMPAGSVISAEKVLTLQPDVIITGREGIADIRQVAGWASGVPAVRAQHFFTPSDPGLITRPGPRLAQGAEELAKFLHPEAFAAHIP